MATDDIKQKVDELFATQHRLSVALDDFIATDPGKWRDADYDYIARAQKALDHVNGIIYGDT